ncbi:MAG: hypothetical protein AAFU85_04620 [Planctomycetota bacterium]
MFDDFILLWSIRFALLCYAASLALLLQGTAIRIRRWIYLAGFLLLVIHVIAAYESHEWSHTNAVKQTAVDTEQTIGVAFGGGIYFNHLFVFVWLIDIVGDWCWPHWPTRFRVASHLYMILIAINGTIVFEPGPTRWVGVLVLFSLNFLGELPFN